jgi:hypothetical protein
VDESSDRWTEVNHSRYPWEREAQGFVREGLPDSDPYAGWANVEFIGDDGTINEIDLLIVSPFGFFLVEIKSHPGIISGDQTRWNWSPPDGKRKQLENPLLLLKRKRDRLENLLFRQSAFRNRTRPRIEPVVFLSSEQLDCQLTLAGWNLGDRSFGLLVVLVWRSNGGLRTGTLDEYLFHPFDRAAAT